MGKKTKVNSINYESTIKASRDNSIDLLLEYDKDNIYLRNTDQILAFEIHYTGVASFKPPEDKFFNRFSYNIFNNKESRSEWVAVASNSTGKLIVFNTNLEKLTPTIDGKIFLCKYNDKGNFKIKKAIIVDSSMNKVEINNLGIINRTRSDKFSKSYSNWGTIEVNWEDLNFQSKPNTSEDLSTNFDLILSKNENKRILLEKIVNKKGENNVYTK